MKESFFPFSVIEETQSDTEGQDEHAQSVFDQPTLLYDYQMETDTAQRSDCQGIVDFSTSCCVMYVHLAEQ